MREGGRRRNALAAADLTTLIKLSTLTLITQGFSRFTRLAQPQRSQENAAQPKS
jgi:hypothetical protein